MGAAFCARTGREKNVRQQIAGRMHFITSPL
jgi:hypothetical protein